MLSKDNEGLQWRNLILQNEMDFSSESTATVLFEKITVKRVEQKLYHKKFRLLNMVAAIVIIITGTIIFFSSLDNDIATQTLSYSPKNSKIERPVSIVANSLMVDGKDEVVEPLVVKEKVEKKMKNTGFSSKHYSGMESLSVDDSIHLAMVNPIKVADTVKNLSTINEAVVIKEPRPKMKIVHYNELFSVKPQIVNVRLFKRIKNVVVKATLASRSQ